MSFITSNFTFYVAAHGKNNMIAQLRTSSKLIGKKEMEPLSKWGFIQNLAQLLLS